MQLPCCRHSSIVAKLSRRRPLKTVNYLALNSDKTIRRDLLFEHTFIFLFSLSSLIRFFKSHRRASVRIFYSIKTIRDIYVRVVEIFTIIFTRNK